MTITRNSIVHEGPGGLFESMVVTDSAADAPRPGVLLFPNVLGTKEADFAYAEKVAALGYAVLVADVYGQGKRTTRADPDAARYMAELNADRALLRDRLLASHALLKGLDAVDGARTATIGFCFGGKCVLDLARAGADIAGGVSFHGVYDAPPFPQCRHPRETADLPRLGRSDRTACGDHGAGAGTHGGGVRLATPCLWPHRPCLYRRERQHA